MRWRWKIRPPADLEVGREETAAPRHAERHLGLDKLVPPPSKRQRHPPRYQNGVGKRTATYAEAAGGVAALRDTASRKRSRPRAAKNTDPAPAHMAMIRKFRLQATTRPRMIDQKGGPRHIIANSPPSRWRRWGRYHSKLENETVPTRRREQGVRQKKG